MHTCVRNSARSLCTVTLYEIHSTSASSETCCRPPRSRTTACPASSSGLIESGYNLEKRLIALRLLEVAVAARRRQSNRSARLLAST
jgi:hypothetical protein